MIQTRFLLGIVGIGVLFLVIGFMYLDRPKPGPKPLAERCSELGGEWLYRSADLLCLMPSGDKLAYSPSQDTFVPYTQKSGVVQIVQAATNTGEAIQDCSQPPRFEDYQSNQAFAGEAKIDFSTNESALHYRTAIKKDVAAGVNLAGKYVMSTWGCGQGCKGAAVINAETGKILAYGLQATKFTFQDESNLVRVGEDEYFVIEQDEWVAWCPAI